MDIKKLVELEYLPICKMLYKYSIENSVRFHMPSHKGVLSPLDITELSFSDNLLCEEGVIKKSEEIFAEAYGAEKCYYLVNGSTSGILALVKSAQGSILVERASHISVFNAVEMFDKKTYVLNNKIEDNRFKEVTLSQVMTAVNLNCDIKTVLLTYPNYYGCCCDLKSIASFLHKKGITLLVDSAHGAHFGLSEVLPTNAIKYCDACVMSTHKTLNALTQSAVILVKNNSLAMTIKNNINLVTSSSPSYLLLASIELGLCLSQKHKNAYKNLVQLREIYKKKFSKIGVDILNNDDITRLVFNFNKLNLSGNDIYNALVEKNIYLEFFDTDSVIAIVSVFHTTDEFDQLFNAIKTIVKTLKPIEYYQLNSFNDDCSLLTFSDNLGTIYLPIDKCIKYVCACSFGVYPPSIPLILKGEVITKQAVDYIKLFKNTFGIVDGMILVYKK